MTSSVADPDDFCPSGFESDSRSCIKKSEQIVTKISDKKISLKKLGFIYTVFMRIRHF
jgi:hypothetical protein